MPNPRELLAQELKQARLDAGYATQGDLAKKLHVTRSLIAKAESPNQPAPSDAVLSAYAAKTGASLSDLRGLAKRATAGSPEWFVPYLSEEQRATILRLWGPLVVPGLLQTKNYARAMLSVEHYTAARLDELVRMRMERQGVLDRARVTAAIDAMVLQRCIGSPKIMAEQCAHLISLSEHPNVSIHVVPDGANVGLAGAFNIASHGSMTTVNLTTVRDIPSTESAMVDQTVQAWEQILVASRSLQESLDFLQAREGHWKEQI